MTDSDLTEQVKDKYAAVARSGLSGDHGGVRSVAEAFGYTPEELAALPAGVNMGLSCGNPTATANLRPGEVVVDLGCGGGIDVLLASQKVGPSGKAIGIDMTPDMIERARKNAKQFGRGRAPANVSFHLAQIEKLPLPENSVDCLISNCVINLAPDKPSVFREMFRVLKPGGRVAVSDIALKQPLPPKVGQDILAYVGCVAGAVLIADYERMLREAGFSAVEIMDTNKDLNAYAKASDAGCCTPAPAGSTACCTPKADAQPYEAGCCTPAPSGSAACCAQAAADDVHGALAELLRRYDVNEYAASVQVFAIKP
jgi:ubiquinone/menaquinone biosynthesis C-methylase UbiE